MRALALLLLLPMTAAADPWVFDFELAYGLPDRTDRLLTEDCTKVVPVQFVQWYAIDPKPGWEVACGNNQPMYYHFLGRRIAKPLPNLSLYLGWSHFSSPGDNHEITFDALAIRGRFGWGKQ
jgi:hypothetical protein